MVKRTYVREPDRRRTLQREPTASATRERYLRCPPVGEGEGSVKKQTLILVVIGLVLFLAGSAIAYASVKGASKHAGGTTVAPVSTTAVVAKTNIPAGTTGQTMVSGGLVAIELIPTKTYSPADLGSLSSLTNEVLTAPVEKGHAVTSAELTASTSSISLPTGMDGVTITVSGTNGLAGYLQPGSRVDVYANITKVSTDSQITATLPLPCTELAMANIEVLDVESTVPSYASHPTSAGRTIPSSETLLLAVNSGDARTIEFLAQNESLSVVQTQRDTNPPPVQQCIGTDQTAGLP
jgi:Flp pilus assembly protein CpaB